MWANACECCPAECRWLPLFNTANSGWCPLLECRAVMLPRHETHWKLLGFPKLVNGSQLLIAEVQNIVTTYGGDIAV